MKERMVMLPRGFADDWDGIWGTVVIPDSIISVRDGTYSLVIPSLPEPREPPPKLGEVPKPLQVAKTTMHFREYDGVMMSYFEDRVYVWESHRNFMGSGVMETRRVGELSE